MASPKIDFLKTYADGDPLYEANLDDGYNSFTTWSNKTANNLDQIVLDAFGATYSLDSDGLKNLASPIYNVSTQGSALPWTFTDAVEFSSGTLSIVSPTAVTGDIDFNTGTVTFTNGIDGALTCDSIDSGGNTAPLKWKKLTGTLDGAAKDTFAHGIPSIDDIDYIVTSVYSSTDSNWHSIMCGGSSAQNIKWDGTNVIMDWVQSEYFSQDYKCYIYYNN